MTEVTEVERGVLFPLSRIFPNRMNPNEMTDWATKYRLRDDLKNDDYDPIVISPARVFYGKDLSTIICAGFDGIEVNFLNMLNLFGVDPDDAYIICDGEQRYNEAKFIEMEEIRVKIEHWAESDSMPHFYKRQTIKGEMNPFKEANLFLFERRVNKLTLEEIKNKYNLGSTRFIRSRLNMFRVSDVVINLFWDPPEDASGLLTYAHLDELSTLANRYQRPVAFMALYKAWTSKDVRREVKRIKLAKGIRDIKGYIEEAKKAHPISKPSVPDGYKEVITREYVEIEPPEETEPPEEREPVTSEPVKVWDDRESHVPAPILRTERRGRPPLIDRPMAPTARITEGGRILPVRVPLVLNGEILEEFSGFMLRRAVEEGRDLGKGSYEDVKEQLLQEAVEHLRRYDSFNMPRDALLAGMRCAQMWALERRSVR